MKENNFNVARLMNDTAFLKKVEDEIFTSMPDNEKGKVVKVNSIGLCYKRSSDWSESFFVNATVNGQTLSFISAIDVKTGNILTTMLTAYDNDCFACQYDIITNSLVGGYASGDGFDPEFWLTGVSVSEIEEAIIFCENHLFDAEIIVGDWQQLKNA